MFSLGLVVLAQEAELPNPGLTPESPFYFLDRLGETLHDFFTFNPEAKARLQLTFVAERIAEIKIMLETKGVEAKGLDVAQAYLEAHAAKIANIVEQEKEKGKDVAELAGEVVDAFHEKRTQAKAIFEAAKKDFQTQKSQLHQELLTAIKTEDVQEQERIREEIAEIEAKKIEAETKKDESVEALEREKYKLQTELEETKLQEDVIRDEIEKAKDEKKEIREKQQEQREKIDETQAVMEKCIKLVYGEGEIISSPEKDIEVKKCVVAYTTEPPIEEPPQLPEEPEQPEYYGPRINNEAVVELMSEEGFIGPGGCCSFEECDIYCKTSGHMKECMTFIIEKGLIKIDLVKMNDERVNDLMSQEDFIGPGGCCSLKECDEYCRISENAKECIVFLDEYSLIPTTEPSPEAPEETPPSSPPSDPIVDKCIELVYGTGEIISSPEKDIEVKKCVMSYEIPPSEETPPEPSVMDPIMEKCMEQVYGKSDIVQTPEKDIELKKCVISYEEPPPEEAPPAPSPVDPVLERCRKLVYGENVPFSLEKEIEVKKCVVAYKEGVPPEEVPPESIKNISPKITLLPVFPELINVGQAIPFTWNAIDENNDDLAWSINWGDGNGTESLCSYTSNQQNWNFNASHAWEKAGIYMLTATVSDCRGGTDSASFNVKVGEVEEVEHLITIISPNGGEALQIRKTYNITWESTLPATGNSEGNTKVNVYLQLGPMSSAQCTLSGICCSICSNQIKITSEVSTSDGKYSWTIPEDIATGKDYKIYIRTINNNCFDNTCLADASDNYFSIIAGEASASESGLRDVENQLASISTAIDKIVETINELLGR